MSSISIAGDVSGAVSLVAPSVAGSTTLNLPASSGTVLTDASTTVVPKGTPAFNAYASSILSLANNTYTKVPVNTEEFDTNNCYDTTLYRFTPNIAGYYNVFAVGGVYPSGATTAAYVAHIYKNGTSFFSMTFSSSNGPAVSANINQLIYMNGSSDYLEFYLYQNTGATRSVESMKFQAFLARGA